jgi:hypothetical protein
MSSGIRSVTVEILRKGPPHNQLLSPLTDYLGICGESEAASVTVPYEQAEFGSHIAGLRYPDADEDDPAPRQKALRTLGQDLGEMLGKVPGLAGSLTEQSSGGDLIHLQLVTSASELSLLPFELAKVPSGTGRPTDDWLLLQSTTRVCMTRRVRSVLRSTRPWPDEAKPRVLFIVGLDVDRDLIDSHRKVLTDALAPWCGSETGKHLVELGTDPKRPATAAGIGAELKNGYPYVHILAHGAESGATEKPVYGLFLPGKHEDEIDVLTGDRFKSILRSLPTAEMCPSVVFAATCDSANQGDLLVPGGSFAHALHVAGVPLVVASQFPLTVQASVSLAESFYSDLFWGEHPLETLSRARAKLHGEFAYTHDWASIVIYDSLPDNLSAQLNDVRYRRSRAALQYAQEEISDTDGQDLEAISRAADALSKLPTTEEYARECEGLRASHEKQMAEAKYRAEKYDEVRRHLAEASKLYRHAARKFLEPRSAVQRHATLHWVQIQAISLDHILAKPIEEWAWWTALQSASIELKEGGGEPYWAHGSLAELWLLRLFDDSLTEDERKEAGQKAEDHTSAILELVDRTGFPVHSTKRQMSRYAELWGDPAYAKNLGLERSARWNDVRRVAKALVKILEG